MVSDTLGTKGAKTSGGLYAGIAAPKGFCDEFLGSGTRYLTLVSFHCFPECSNVEARELRLNGQSSSIPKLGMRAQWNSKARN